MLLKKVQVPHSSAPIFLGDNVSVLALATNLVFHARTMYVEVDFHLGREKVFNRDISLNFNISMYDQVANIFTKGLSSAQYSYKIQADGRRIVYSS